MDMHSGGSLKEKQQYIFIEAPENEAKVIFYNRFGHNPERVSCTCCGEDYSISEYDSLEQATAYYRHCEYAYINKKSGKRIPGAQGFISGKGVKRGYEGRYVEEQRQSNLKIRKDCNTPEKDKWGVYIPLSKFIKQKDVLVIHAENIRPKERTGEVPRQGYVYVE